MANLSDLSRREQVLEYLNERKGEWVDGPELSNERVGGSEGLKRLRELRAQGYRIMMRKHPDPERDIFQYCLVDEAPVSPVREGVAAPPPPIPIPFQARKDERLPKFDNPKFLSTPRGISIGDVIPCDRCSVKGKKLDDRRRDPIYQKLHCLKCNGWGIIPR